MAHSAGGFSTGELDPLKEECGSGRASVTNRMPRVGDRAAAERGPPRWSRSTRRPCSPSAGDLERLLASIFGNSPYLSELLLSEPASSDGCWRSGPMRARRAARRACRRAARKPRQAHGRPAPARAAWPADGVGGHHRPVDARAGDRGAEPLADLSTQQAVDLVLREAAQRGEIELAEQDRPQDESGLVVLGWASSARSSSTIQATSI